MNTTTKEGNKNHKKGSVFRIKTNLSYFRQFESAVRNFEILSVEEKFRQNFLMATSIFR